MKKPNQIRKVLEQANPFFVANPDKLQLFIDDGKIIRTGTDNLSFELQYSLNIIVTDYPDDIARLTVPLLAYLQINQPELFANPDLRDKAIRFLPDFNNNNTSDIHFEISPITERVVVKQSQADSVILDYKPEPVWGNERVRVYFENEDNLIWDSELTHGNH
ncbi:phage tail protein [Lonepinella sp. BR2919]|uniref:phage tail protein n=1 Tax=unclassified Lonepinella TaxID=2642006 RepID=UPI003F6E3BCF